MEKNDAFAIDEPMKSMDPALPMSSHRAKAGSVRYEKYRFGSINRGIGKLEVFLIAYTK